MYVDLPFSSCIIIIILHTVILRNAKVIWTTKWLALQRIRNIIEIRQKFEVPILLPVAVSRLTAVWLGMKESAVGEGIGLGGRWGSIILATLSI